MFEKRVSSIQPTHFDHTKKTIHGRFTIILYTIPTAGLETLMTRGRAYAQLALGMHFSN
jgi:hypothetical protein